MRGWSVNRARARRAARADPVMRRASSAQHSAPAREEEVARGVAEQVDVARIVEAHGLPGEQERQFERDAVEPVGDCREVGLGFPDDVAPIFFGDLALSALVGGDPVIVEDGGADRSEEGAGGEEDAEARGPARHFRPSPARSISPSHSLRHPPPPSGANWPVRMRRMG